MQQLQWRDLRHGLLYRRNVPNHQPHHLRRGWRGVRRVQSRDRR
jgi:hypothetical protein